ncbi:MAG: hypothetical protein FJ100_14890 [Deltaproteobacteria bacterium]|nr:hypothetical protein [Deltaproteobacteria bacterium]
MTRRIRFSKLAAAAILLCSWMLLSAFRPFSPISSVCPACPERGDKVVFPDGKVVVAEVIAKNQDGYILQKYGELRFVQTREIAKVEWQSGAEPRGLANYDQILLKGDDQKVLHGTLIPAPGEPGKMMAMRSPKGYVYTVIHSQVLLYYQQGTRKAAPKDPAAGG